MPWPFRRRAQEALSEERALTYQDGWGTGADWAGGATAAGPAVTQEGSLGIGAVYAAVTLLAESIASLPVDSFIHWNESRKPYRPTPLWLEQPNLEDGSMDFWEQVMTSLLLDGNAYSLVTRDTLGLPLELIPLHPSLVTPTRNRSGALVYDVRSPDTSGLVRVGRYTATSGNLWHIRAFRVPGALKGISPIEKARQTLGLSIAAEEYGARFFSKSAMAGGVIEFPAEAKVDEVGITQMIELWKKHHQGRSNAHVPGVLSGGATWKQISIPNDHAQFIETRKFSVAEIARWYRVPPHLIGDVERSTSWGTGIEEQNLAFVTYSLRPWLVRLEQAASVLMPSKAFIKFNLEGLLRARTLERYQAYASARQAGWLSVDEIREKEDRAPLPDGAGQIFLEPVNMAPAGSQPVTGSAT